MALKVAPEAAQPANPNLDLASNCDPESFNSCIFCSSDVDRWSEEYVVILCSFCGHYPIHRQCLQDYLDMGLGDYKKPVNMQRRNVWEMLDTQQYGHKQKRKVMPADLANQVMEENRQNRQKAQQAKQAGQLPEKQKPAAKGKVGAGGAGVVSNTTAVGHGANYGGEVYQHDIKMTGIEAELAIYHGFIKEKKFKTKLCPLERSPGACPYGDLCNDAHTVKELRIDEAIKLGHVNTPYKCMMCKPFALKGQCAKGLYCPDAHSVKERRTAVAIRHDLERMDYKTTYCSSAGTQQCCPYGLLCRYAHSIEEHRRDAAWQVGGASRLSDCMYKLKLCVPFFKDGTCRFGFMCHNAHGHRDLRVTAALEAKQLPRRFYKTLPCSKGMACATPSNCWDYHSEADRMSPYFFSKRRLCPTKQELGTCALENRPDNSCPFAHEVYELDIVDYVERKVQRQEKAKAAAGRAVIQQQPQAEAVLPGSIRGWNVPASVLEGKLPAGPSFLAKESQGLSKSAAKRQAKKKKSDVEQGQILEGEEDGEGVNGMTWETSSDLASASGQAEKSSDVPQYVVDMMKRYKLDECYQTLISMGLDKDRAWVVSRCVGADVKAALELVFADPEGNFIQAGEEAPITVELELQGLLLAATEWGLTQQDVISALQMHGGNYDRAQEGLLDLGTGERTTGDDDKAPVDYNPWESAQPSPAMAPTTPSPAAPAAARARPSPGDNPEDEGFATPSSAYIIPLPFATHAPTPAQRGPSPTRTLFTPATAMQATDRQNLHDVADIHQPRGTHMPCASSPLAATQIRMRATVTAGPLAPAVYVNVEPSQEAPKSRPWWPEEAFLNFSPNASLRAAVPQPSDSPAAPLTPHAPAHPPFRSPSAKNEAQDKKFGPPNSAFHVPLPYPAHAVTQHTQRGPTPLAATQTSIAVGHVPTAIPMVMTTTSTASAFSPKLYVDVKPSQGQASHPSGTVLQGGHNFRPWWPEHAFLGFSPNPGSRPSAGVEPFPATPQGPQHTLKHASPPEAAAQEAEEDGDDEEAKLMAMMANLL